MSRILTSHVGSLPRTQEVVDFIFARENEQPYDPDAFQACMTAACAETSAVRWMPGSLFDCETSKISMPPMSRIVIPAFPVTAPQRPQDRKCFRAFERLADDGGTPQYARPMCTGEVKSKGQGELETDTPISRPGWHPRGQPGFMNAASPG